MAMRLANWHLIRSPKHRADIRKVVERGDYSKYSGTTPHGVDFRNQVRVIRKVYSIEGKRWQ